MVLACKSSIAYFCDCLLQNGVILVDEIDNAIHVSAFEEVFRWFAETCLKYNVQAFITTHSVEAIDAIVKTALQFSDDLDPIRVYTMRKSCKRILLLLRLVLAEKPIRLENSLGWSFVYEICYFV